MHNGQFWRKIVEELPFFAEFSPKMTYVRPKCVPWRSNQEWRSIGADTVLAVHAFNELVVSNYSYCCPDCGARIELACVF